MVDIATPQRSDAVPTERRWFVLPYKVPRDSASLKRAMAWLSHSQDAKDGRWLAYSVNKQRDLASDVGRFMSDAATAYSVLALEGAR